MRTSAWILIAILIALAKGQHGHPPNGSSIYLYDCEKAMILREVSTDDDIYCQETNMAEAIDSAIVQKIKRASIVIQTTAVSGTLE